MGAYYKHTKTESIKVPYSFRCEQCKKDSGQLQATIVGSEAVVNSNYKTLNEKKQHEIDDMAHKNLVQAVKEAYKDATEKQIYCKAFSDKCPHCGQPQSWAVSGLMKERFSTPIVCLILGVIIGLGCYFFVDRDNKLIIALAAAGVCVAAAIVTLIYNSIKIASKQKKTSGVTEKNLPVIEWEAVQHIIDEQ